MPKIKKIYSENFTIISNQFIENVDLTLKAKGLFLYIWSRPDNWNFYVSQLVKSSKAGRDQVMSALDELEKHGYLFRSRNRNKLGQLTNRSTWLLSDTPKKSWIEQKNKKAEAKKSKTKKTVNKSVDNYSEPKSENPTQGKPTLENQKLPSTNLTKDLSNKGLNSSLSKSLPRENHRSVPKQPAIDNERDKKIIRIIDEFDYQRKHWHVEDMKPVSNHERNQLANAIGNHQLKEIMPLISTAVSGAQIYPMGYLLTMIRNLPEAGYAERIR